MRVHATLHGFSERERELDLAPEARADDAPRALGIRPELVLVFRGDRPLPADEPLREGDRIRILRVVSGGFGSRASPRRRAGALALAAVALLLLPTLAADHVYSHRYVVDGRLVGSDGLPLPGREVRLTSSTTDFLEPCREGTRPLTDEHGDFRFCYHRHEFSTIAPRFNVTYGNVTVERAVDVALRRTSLLLEEPNETGVAPEGWSTTYRVSGRVWRPGPMMLEGVQVFGEALIGVPVNLTIHTGPNATTVFRSQTDAYGDFDLVVETEGDASNLSLSLEALGRGQPVQLDERTHRTFAAIYAPPGESAEGEPITGGFDTRPAPPGSATPRLNPVLLVALALALVAAIVLSRRK